MGSVRIESQCRQEPLAVSTCAIPEIPLTSLKCFQAHEPCQTTVEVSVGKNLVKCVLKQCGKRHTLVVLDCCQNRPAGRGSGAEVLGRGAEDQFGSIARDVSEKLRGNGVRGIPTVAVLNSCREGQCAYEWNQREHGIFTGHLLERMAAGETGVARLSRSVAGAVESTAFELYRQHQTPFSIIEGAGDIELGSPVDGSWQRPQDEGAGILRRIQAFPKSGLHKVKKAELFIGSEPLNAEVTIDGAAKGRTPVYLDEVVVGESLMVEARLGTMSAWKEHRVHEGFNELSLVLEQERGNVVIQTAEQEAEVYIDHERIGPVGKGLLRGMAAGVYEIELRLPGRKVVRTVEVVKDTTVRMVPVFVGMPYRISFDSQGGGAPSMESKSVVYGQSYGTLATATRSGYRFGGWWTGPEGTGVMVKPGTEMKKDGAHALYAKWIAFSIPMTHVEGGPFQMGSTSGGVDEHTVTVDSFQLGTYEVTQGLYQRVMGGNPSNWKGDRLPVEQVSWFDAVAFCNALSRKDGLEQVYTIKGETVKCDWGKKGYRLPTEAEWEYASRGENKSTGYTYAGSNAVGDVAWYTDNSGSKTHEVGGKKANELGLYDMSGNVWEWCWDWYESYSASAVTNPRGPSSGSNRVLRGGSWGDSTKSVRTAYRVCDDPSLRDSSIRFRVSAPVI